MTQTVRYQVQAIAAEGLSYYNRAGRPWPRGQGFVEIEVVPDDMAPPPVRGLPGPEEVIMVGESDFKILKTDAQIRLLSTPGGRTLPAPRPPIHGTPVAPVRKLPPQTAAPVSTPVPAQPVSVSRGKPGPKPKTPVTPTE